MPHPFMTGWWSNVVVASFAVPPAVLARYVPPGVSGAPLELDVSEHACFRLGDGRPGAVVSVVAQQCSHVRVMGVKWPFLNRFDAMYLRLCVRQGQRKGVVYVREIVPRRLIAWGGRKSYNQPCVTAPVEGEIKQQTLLIGAEYRVWWPDGGMPPGGHVTKEMRVSEQMVRVVGSKPPQRPAGEVERWLYERPLVYGMEAQGKPLVYEVIHPAWGVYPIVECTMRMDLGSMFGADFGFLNGRDPNHAMLAAGSEVAVFPKRESAVVRWGERREPVRRK